MTPVHPKMVIGDSLSECRCFELTMILAKNIIVLDQTISASTPTRALITCRRRLHGILLRVMKLQNVWTSPFFS